jgi:hypothetical protein
VSLVLRRGALVGVIAAILGSAAIPAVGYSAHATKHEAQCKGKSCKSKAKKKCKKGQVRAKDGKCVKKKTAPTPTTPTTNSPEAHPEPKEVGPEPAPGAPFATLVVHVNKADENGTEADETAPLFIAKFSHDEFVGKLKTTEHTVHVTPGHYEITALAITNETTAAQATTKVEVTAGQTVEVTLTIF